MSVASRTVYSSFATLDGIADGKAVLCRFIKKKLPQICRRERTWTKYAFSHVNKICVLIFSAQVTFAVCWRYFVPCKTRDDSFCTLSVSYPTLTLWRTLVLYRGLDTHLYAPYLQKVDQTLEYNRTQGYFFFSFSFFSVRRMSLRYLPCHRPS